MSTFDANSAKKSNNFSDLAIEYFPYWKPVFEHIGVEKPVFKSKLCYNSNEFKGVEEKLPAARFFESELDAGADIYMELCNWDHNYYDPMYRQLYKLPYDPDWKNKPDNYAKSNNPNVVTYAVRISDFELVNETSITKSLPEIKKEKSILEEVEEDDENRALSDLVDHLDDDHISKKTIRDEYCIRHNIPLSNKKWLNDLIKEGTKWQK